MSLFNPISPKPLTASQQRGKNAEQQACDFLLNQGLRLRDKNFSCRLGEIDLIMVDEQTLVIIEVRFRSNSAYGGAVASVTPKKQAKIIATTQYYLMRYSLNCNVRFDVVAIEPKTGINWIKNAFQT